MLLSIVLVVVLIFIFYTHTQLLTEFISGMWVANKDFIESADVNGMMLYIGKPEWTLTGYQHDSYIIVLNNIYNGEFNLSYQLPLLRYGGIHDFSVTTTCHIWQGNLRMTIDMANAELIIYNDEVVYCKMTKQLHLK